RRSDGVAQPGIPGCGKERPDRRRAAGCALKRRGSDARVQKEVTKITGRGQIARGGVVETLLRPAAVPDGTNRGWSLATVVLPPPVRRGGPRQLPSGRCEPRAPSRAG